MLCIQLLSKDDIMRAQELLVKVYIDEKIIDYIVNIVFATREPAQFHVIKNCNHLFIMVFRHEQHWLYSVHQKHMHF